MSIKTKEMIPKAMPVLFLISIIALTMFPPNVIQQNEKTTTLNVEKANSALLLDISHRYYDEFRVDKNENAFLVLVFNIRLPLTDNRFNLWALPVESGQGTTVDLELDDLPDGCAMGSHYIITDSRGGSEDKNLQFAVVAMFRAGNQKWEITNPKVSVDNLLVALNERLSYWGSPPVRINVEEMLLDYSEFVDWRRGLPMQVKIGVVFSDFLNWGHQIIRFAEDDINQYCVNIDAHYDFEFIRTSGGNNPEQHQQAVQMFDELGLNLLIGGYLSHQVPDSLDYVNERNILLVSPSSTGHMLAIPYDNLFRLSPPNTYEGRVIAEMIASHGISAVVFLLLEDEHIVSLAESIKWELDQIPGCDFYDAIGYNRELENIEDQLELANIRVGDANVEYNGAENVALIYLGFEEIANIVEIIEAEGFSNLENTLWFCSSDQVFNEDLIHGFLGKTYPPILFVPYARPDETNWTQLSDRYYDATGGNLSRSFSFMIANEYDACWLYAKAIIDTGTMDTEAIKAWLYENASTYHGVSGPVNLDENGDRTEVVYDFWCIVSDVWTKTGNWTEADGADWLIWP